MHARAVPVNARPTEVLFVCVHNAGRSQIAAAWLQHLAGDRVVVRSAGTAPADTINPAVVEVMREVGIDLHGLGAHPKRLDDAAVEASDIVITMGCGDTCPFYPGTRYLDWELDDPAGQGVDAVRPIRDEIERRVRSLLDDLGVTPVPGARALDADGCGASACRVPRRTDATGEHGQ